MAEQITMDSILGDDKPAPKEPAAKEEIHIPVLGEELPDAAAKEVADTERKEAYKSKRQQARDKESIAQGKVRDPDTGQYVSPKPEAAAAAPAAATKAEVPAVAEPAKPAAPQQEFTEKEKAFLRAAQEERGKRQELERRLAAMEASKPAEPVKTFWDDPEAALKAHEDRIKAEGNNARLNMAEFSARQRHTDFDEKIAVFSTLIQQTPGLHQQWLASPDPAEFAYALGKNHKELQEVGGIEQLRAKIQAETTTRVRAEVEAELKAKADKLAQDRAALPPSLSDARSTGGANKPVWGGPESMEEILKG